VRTTRDKAEEGKLGSGIRAVNMPQEDTYHNVYDHFHHRLPGMGLIETGCNRVSLIDTHENTAAHFAPQGHV
jgi:hypothetical protein